MPQTTSAKSLRNFDANIDKITQPWLFCLVHLKNLLKISHEWDSIYISKKELTFYFSTFIRNSGLFSYSHQSEDAKKNNIKVEIES